MRRRVQSQPFFGQLLYSATWGTEGRASWHWESKMFLEQRETAQTTSKMTKEANRFCKVAFRRWKITAAHFLSLIAPPPPPSRPPSSAHHLDCWLRVVLRPPGQPHLQFVDVGWESAPPTEKITQLLLSLDRSDGFPRRVRCPTANCRALALHPMQLDRSSSRKQIKPRADKSGPFLSRH